MINNGDKIKFVYLKKSTIQSERMSFLSTTSSHMVSDLPNILIMNYNLRKFSLEPVKNILDAIGWNVEKTVNLNYFWIMDFLKEIVKRLVMSILN